ncbi:MAG: HD domain-containing protein [Lachnospiraceae bacterium]|nr:HD domain-containing protein [Lachnospiraceae bacterium]
MKGSEKAAGKRIIRLGIVLAGVVFNIAFYSVMGILGNPLYLDTVGTIAVTMFLGPFYGIFVAVASNLISTIFYANAIYYSSVNALIAIYTARFIRKRAYKTLKGVIAYVLVIAVMAGVFSSLIEMAISGDSSQAVVNEVARSFGMATGLPYFASVIITSIFMNIGDKAVACVLAMLLLRIIPKSLKEKVTDRKWVHSSIYLLQPKKDLTGDKPHHSIRVRTTGIMIASSMILAVFVGWVSVRMYFDYEKNSRVRTALGSAQLASTFIDAERIDTYINEGENTPGYTETREKITRIYANANKVAYLYVVQHRNGLYRAVFDVEGEEGDPEPYQPGEEIEFAEGFDEYLEAVDAGTAAEPIETSDGWGHLITVAYPVRNQTGVAAAYVIADVSVEDLMDFVWEFVIKTVLILAGVLILIVAFELWITETYMVRPIAGMVRFVDRFAAAGDDQGQLDSNVKMIRKLDIRTGDEVEKLYSAICTMTLKQAEQMRNIRHLSEATATMQDGLIITMADLVESRDSDTGAHVQKTAAYVKIIAEGLREKGYYAGKVTPRFISDIVRSAPLHDIGKISIPDGILNQARKLTDEEYEIMKTHTTAGKQIIEKAINTVQGGMYLKEARNMAAYHHERWDGRGYPEALHGEVIPLSARIMAVADVFDALTSPRVYKAAIPVEEALKIIEEGSGTQFDPKCVEVFLGSVSEAKVILKKYSRDV